MLDSDEIVVFVVDANGQHLDKCGPVQWSGELRKGQVIPLIHKGRETLFSVLGVRPGEGRGRFVQVTEYALMCPLCKVSLLDGDGLAGVEPDEKGHHVTCRHCGGRVVLQPIPTPPGSGVRFRVAPHQDG